MIKIGLVYTSTTPELIELVEKEVHGQIGSGAQLMTYSDPSILAEIREHGYVTCNAACRLITMFLQAAQDGADAVLNICSSVGETADSAQAVARYIGVPIVRIDEEMCRDAVRMGSRIGVLATLPTTLEPTKNTLYRAAREMGRQITLVDGLVKAFGLDQEQFKKLLLEKAREISGQVSMSFCFARAPWLFVSSLLPGNVIKKPCLVPATVPLPLKQP